MPLQESSSSLAGQKQVTRTTTERFTTPVEEVEVGDESEPGQIETKACGYCSTVSPVNEWSDNDGDCPSCNRFPEPSREGIEAEFISPAELLLSNLNMGRRSNGVAVSQEPRIRIYINRLADPRGSTFLRSCPNGEGCEPLPFDDEFVTREAIEAAIQQRDGGGRYQVKIFVNGQPGGHGSTWTTEPPLADPIREERTPISQPDPSVAASAPSPSMQLDEVLSIAERIVNIRRSGPAAIPATVAAEPQRSLADQFTEMAAMMNAGKALFGVSGGESSAVPKTNVAETISNTLVDLAKAPIALPVVQFVMMMINERHQDARALAAEKLAEAKAKRQASGAAEQVPVAGRQVPVQEAAPAPPPPVQIEWPEPATIPGSSSSGTANVPSAFANPSPDQIQDLMLITAVLDQVITNMRLFEETSDDDEGAAEDARLIDESVAALRRLPAETLNQVLNERAANIVAFLSGQRADWNDIADLETAVSFVNELKTALSEPAPEIGLAELETLVGEEVVPSSKFQVPSLVESEAGGNVALASPAAASAVQAQAKVTPISSKSKKEKIK